MGALADIFQSFGGPPTQAAPQSQPFDPSPGTLEAGNIDLTNRPRVQNPDGTISTVRSMDVYVGPDGRAMLGGPEPGNRVLLPTVSDDGRIMSDQEAIDQYHTTGRHLGKFISSDHAGAFAQRLHDDQARRYKN